MTNSKGLTPVHIYEATHKRYLNEANEKGKGIANSGMVVATLIATIAFAAALTVPGDHKTNNAGFIVFMLANAVALFTSSASIISFFSVFFHQQSMKQNFKTQYFYA
ncbi:PGG domain [Sesbania bispinosa]|nr:PGG domain [Sesbania bispinosa]